MTSLVAGVELFPSFEDLLRCSTCNEKVGESGGQRHLYVFRMLIVVGNLKLIQKPSGTPPLVLSGM